MVNFKSSFLKRNVDLETEKSVRNNEKKLTNLTKNTNNPFTNHEIITNLSTYDLSSEELDLLRHGLQHSIPTRYLNKWDIFCSFELIHRFLKEDLKNAEAGHLKSDLSHLANSFYYNYYPTKKTLKKQGILKRLRSNTRIVILKPNKGCIRSRSV